MRRSLGWAGAVLGGTCGWYLGAQFSFFSAFMASIAGLGLGMYAGYRLAMRYY